MLCLNARLWLNGSNQQRNIKVPSASSRSRFKGEQKMNAITSAFGFMSLCLVLLIGSVPSAASTKELLYVQEGQDLVTYSVSSTTAVTKKLGTVSMNLLPRVIRRSGSFLYVLGTTATHECFNVYALSSAGVPAAKPVQTLLVKHALTQFYIHPNGTDAYAMFSWTEDVKGTTEFVSDIVLFTIDPKTGKLTNTKRNIANFPLSADWSTSINFVNSRGTELYTTDIFHGPCHTCLGPSYFSSTIDAKTGLLSPRVYFWSDSTHPSSFFGGKIFVYDEFSFNVYTMGVEPRSLIAGCDASILLVCGDHLQSVFIHPSNNYLFLLDDTTNEVPILYVSAFLKKLNATGSTIPGFPSLIAFSSDGLLVYAAEGKEILVHVFNPHTGMLTARTSIAVKGVDAMLPGQ
jgi:hypothetical protein